MITVISVGKKHDPLLAEAIGDYEKRLRAPFAIKWVFLPHAATEGSAARRDESKAIVSTLVPSDYVLLLDERGTMIDSLALSNRLNTVLSGSRPVKIIIGGAFGVDESLVSRADFIWSLSPLVFPHRLVRLLLAEQLYRAQTIQSGGSYHHE